MDHHLRATQDLLRTGDQELEQPPQVTSESRRPIGTRAHTCKCVRARCDRYVPVAITRGRGLCVKFQAAGAPLWLR